MPATRARLSPAELRQHLGQGILAAFPVTPFTAGGELDLPRLREHIGYLLSHRPGAIFVCGGTGEFPALTFAEWRAAVAAAVEEVAGAVPVLAGAGYAVPIAREYVRAAGELGCDGVLLFPPYGGPAEQEGLYAHYAAVLSASPVGVVLYQRDQAVFAPETVARLAAFPALAAFKDGLGEVERLQRIALATEGRLPLMNGLPTAEMSQPALGAAGAASYSSAVFNFVPELALRFYRALRAGDAATVAGLLDGFYRPFCALREQRRGYAVALIKAGLRLCGRPCGPVRPPLVEPSEEHLDRLRALLRAQGVAVQA
jgi:5-dehydro-4-deoxyglucarate dehydratase